MFTCTNFGIQVFIAYNVPLVLHHPLQVLIRYIGLDRSTKILNFSHLFTQIIFIAYGWLYFDAIRNGKQENS